MSPKTQDVDTSPHNAQKEGTGNLRGRVDAWYLSSGGSALYDDDSDPRHLLFLVAKALRENDWTLPPDGPPIPCLIRSSITEQPCLLPEGHRQFSPSRFHKYEPLSG